jgi:hypothetical protein
MKSKPSLVDYNFINFPKKELSELQKKIIKTDNSKLYLNLFMISILCIGIYVLYSRMTEKEEIDSKNKKDILFLNEYINNSLNYMDNLKTLQTLQKINQEKEKI